MLKYINFNDFLGQMCECQTPQPPFSGGGSMSGARFGKSALRSSGEFSGGHFDFGAEKALALHSSER